VAATALARLQESGMQSVASRDTRGAASGNGQRGG